VKRIKVFFSSVAWPLLVAAVFALLFRSLYEQNGVVDLPLAWILIGLYVLRDYRQTRAKGGGK